MPQAWTGELASPLVEPGLGLLMGGWERPEQGGTGQVWGHPAGAWDPGEGATPRQARVPGSAVGSLLLWLP